MKKRKGFSELIIVIALILFAVVVGVLARQVLYPKISSALKTTSTQIESNTNAWTTPLPTP